jgi:hypothetical protein
MTIMGWAAVFCAGITAACFVVYLIFLAFVIVKTGSTDGLGDVAKAISAYRRLPSRVVQKKKSSGGPG